MRFQKQWRHLWILDCLFSSSSKLSRNILLLRLLSLKYPSCCRFGILRKPVLTCPRLNCTLTLYTASPGRPEATWLPLGVLVDKSLSTGWINKTNLFYNAERQTFTQPFLQSLGPKFSHYKSWSPRPPPCFPPGKMEKILLVKLLRVLSFQCIVTGLGLEDVWKVQYRQVSKEELSSQSKTAYHSPFFYGSFQLSTNRKWQWEICWFI